MGMKCDDASRFFGALYEKPQTVTRGEYDEAVCRLVVKTVGNVVVGDQALQSLLTNFVAQNADAAEVNQRDLWTMVAGIKQRAVEAVTKAFPRANVDELVDSARRAGFDVQVLG